ncbi:hypothetical protein DFJ58DRAFT_652248 [Suillus subalutaceus]|uniref:uncharacterized protein n=1 Tax=Suillus subalutaceus TaxID=48586 RepID=UPI001B863B1D|nr:uncharacterized protein DFJ58DRAFT_652248 [Suillus subalutaceus]KAG1872305.1 hypothetical protein DFJ58DRAFT_652248 [Suillus subalutaceus]
MTLRTKYLEPWIQARENLERRDWLSKDKEKEETQTLIDKVYNALGSISWSANIRGFSNTERTVTLATYCTDEWLSDIQENQMLDLLQRRLQHEPGGQQIKVESVYFYILLKRGYDARHFTCIWETRHALSSGLGPSCIGFLVNVNRNHWVAVIVNFNSRSILYGDSLNQEPPNDMLAILHWWMHHHTGHRFTTRSLEITYQKDAFSCGLLSFNALAHHFLPMEYPLIAVSNVRNGRLKILLDIIDQHLDQAGVRHLQGRTLLTSLFDRASSPSVKNISSPSLNPKPLLTLCDQKVLYLPKARLG